MKCSAIVLAAMMTAGVDINALEEQPNGLDSLQWKYRVILIFAREPFASRALANLDEFAVQIEDRDIAWFVLGEDALQTNYEGKLARNLHEQLVDSYFTPLPAESAVLLIGKDGTVKSRSADLDLEGTFGLIDQMPMRLEEMRHRSDHQD